MGDHKNRVRVLFNYFSRLKPVRAGAIPGGQREAFAKVVGPLTDKLEHIEAKSPAVARSAAPPSE